MLEPSGAFVALAGEMRLVSIPQAGILRRPVGGRRCVIKSGAGADEVLNIASVRAIFYRSRRCSGRSDGVVIW